MIPAAADPIDPRGLITHIRRYTHPITPIPSGCTPRLPPLPNIQAVLFDVYGTLFVSASGDIGTSQGEARGLAFEEAFQDLRMPADPRAAHRAAVLLVELITRTHQRLKGAGHSFPEVEIREVFREILEHLRTEGLVHTEASRKVCEALAVAYECRSNPTWPMPGLTDTLQGLSRRGMTLGIVSNAQFYTPLLFPAHLEMPLQQLGFEQPLCLWSYQQQEAKPSPLLFRRALAALQSRGIEAAQVLYVGNDRINDIWPAAQTGMKTALFAGDRRSFRPREEDPRGRELPEDAVITELAQLDGLLRFESS